MAEAARGERGVGISDATEALQRARLQLAVRQERVGSIESSASSQVDAARSLLRRSRMLAEKKEREAKALGAPPEDGEKSITWGDMCCFCCCCCCCDSDDDGPTSSDSLEGIEIKSTASPSEREMGIVGKQKSSAAKMEQADDDDMEYDD